MEIAMRGLVLAGLVMLVAGCSSVPAVPVEAAAPPSADSASRNYLLDSAAADFRDHGPAPARFRSVRYGVVEGAGGSSMSLLCGEFQARGGSEEWVAFATLQTSKYEQWLGAAAKGFCERPAFGWDADDLSSELQKRFEAAEK
jgi:hypothetical protein